MKKLLRNPGTSYITVRSIDLTLAPGDTHTLTDLEKIEWMNDSELLGYVRNGSIQVGYWENSYYTDVVDGEVWLRTADQESFTVSDSTTIVEYQDAIVQDATTGVKSTSILANLLLMMRELYNNTDNPFYSSSFQQLIGTGGREVEHLARTLNLETIHGKGGWHYNQIKNLSLKAPKSILFYYGWLNSFNSSTNSWTNEKVAKDMSKYEILIFGDGIQSSSHGDYSNTSVILARLKVLNPNCLIFGYVATPETLTDFQTKVDQWDTLHIDGIFMDEAGYDYGTNRTDFNTRVDYIHGKTYAKLCFVNSWNMDHILGTTEDASYPNSTWNSSLTASALNSSDWYLLESFPINTTAYTGSIETASEWLARGNKATSLRSTYNINLASVGVINNDNTNGQALFNFQYISALMFSLDGVGSSDTNYGSSSAAVTFWNRIDLGGLEGIWAASPSVQSSSVVTTQYERPVRSARLGLDFASGYSGYVNRDYISGSNGVSGYSGISGISGYSGYSGISGISGYSGISGISGYSGYSSYSGLSGYSGYSSYSGISGYSGLSSSPAYYLASNFTTTSTSATATNLQFSMEANTAYIVEITLTAQCSSTGGCKFSVSVGTSSTGVTIEGWVFSDSSSLTAFRAQRITALSTLTGTAVHTVATTPMYDNIIFTIINGSTAQTCIFNAASNTSGQTTTIFAGSSMRVRKASSL